MDFMQSSNTNQYTKKQIRSNKDFYDQQMLQEILLNKYNKIQNTDNFFKYLSSKRKKILEKLKNRQQLGDFVIFYVNQKKVVQQYEFNYNKNKINQESAQQIFDNLFYQQKDDDKKFMDIFKQSYIQAFQQLKNYQRTSSNRNIFNQFFQPLQQKEDDYKLLFDPNQSQPQHINDQNVQVQSYIDLLKRTIELYFAYHGFFMRQFISSDQKYLCLVFYAIEKNLLYVASQNKFQKFYEFAKLDLLSLEPVDKKCRPLRIHKDFQLVNNENLMQKSQIQQQSYDIRKDIKKLIDEIQFQNIMRDINGLMKTTYNIQDTDTLQIFQQNNITQQEYESYKRYLLNLKELIFKHRNEFKERKIQIQNQYKNQYKKKMNKISQLQNQLAENYKVALLQCIKQEKSLKNIWQQMQCKPQSFKIQFFYPSNQRKNRNKYFFKNIWQKDPIIYLMNTKYMNYIEKHKLIESKLFNIINFEYLSETLNFFYSKVLHAKLTRKQSLKKYCYYYLHDYRTLKGLNPFLDNMEYKVDQNMEQFVVDTNQTNTFLDENEQNLVAQKLQKLWPVTTHFSLKPLKIWKTQCRILMNYFGNKIYFIFKIQIAYLKSLFWLTIVGCIIWIFDLIIYFFDSYFKGENKQNSSDALWVKILGTVIIWVYGVAIIIWSMKFYIKIDLKEKNFKLQNNDNINEKDERKKFKTYQLARSFENDKINEKKPKYNVIYSRLFLVIFFSIIFFCLSFGLSILIFYLKYIAIEKSWTQYQDYENVQWKQNIFNLFEIVKIIIFDLIYQQIIIKLIKWIDPPTTTQFEKMLVIFLSCFGLFNNFFVIIFISMIKEQFIQCSTSSQTSVFKGECLIEAQVYYRTYIFFKMFFRILLILYSIIKIKILKVYQKKKHQKFSIYYNNNQKDNFSYANFYVEQHRYLKNYQISKEFDTSVFQFYNIYIEYSALVLFGILYPLSFLQIFIANYIYIYQKKQKLIHLDVKQTPFYKSNFRNWYICYKFVILIGFATNGYVLTVLYSDWYLSSVKWKLVLFILYFVFNIILAIIIIQFSFKPSMSEKFLVRRKRFIQRLFYERVYKQDPKTKLNHFRVMQNANVTGQPEDKLYSIKELKQMEDFELEEAKRKTHLEKLPGIIEQYQIESESLITE